MPYLLIRWIINALALYVAVELVPGIHFTGDVKQFLLVALVFGLVNALLRPLITVLTCPLIVLTLGLFALVINAIMLLATAALSRHWGLGFGVDGFWAAFWGGLVIAIVSVILSVFVGGKKRGDD